jgi:hypothetical protein
MNGLLTQFIRESSVGYDKLNSFVKIKFFSEFDTV